MAKKKKTVTKKVKPKKVTSKKTAGKKTVVAKKAVNKLSSKKQTVKKTTTKNKTQPTKTTAPKNIKKIDYSKVISPLGERVVVKLTQAEQVTAGGIIIPNTVDTKTGYLKGQVLAIGSGIKTKKGHIRPLDVQVGDTVLFQGYASVKVEFNAEELHIVNESDVLGIV